MNIIAAEVLEYVRKLDGRSWNPVSRWMERRAPLVLLHAGSGLTGIGEAWCRQEEIGRVLEALATLIERRVVGRRFGDEEAIRALAAERSGESWATSAAASGVDIALWDLLAKSRGEPLWNTLGGATGRVRVYASGGLYRDGAAAADLAAEVRRYLSEGFRDVKIKVGALPVDVDAERVAAARAAMDVDGELWVDAVNQLRPDTAPRAAAAYAGAGASAIQAPVAFDDFETMAKLNSGSIPVIAGESEFSSSAFAKLLEAHAVGYLQFNPGLCGGFSGAVPIAAAAAARSVRVTPQVHATAVLQSVALHCGAAIAGTHSVEYHRFHDHLRFLLPAALCAVDAGVVDLADRPGLGIATLAHGAQADGGWIHPRHALG